MGATTASSGLAVETTSTCFTTSTLIATTAPCTSPWTGSLALMLAAKRRFQRSGTARSLARKQMRQQCTLQVQNQERSSNWLKKTKYQKYKCMQNANTQI